MSLGRPPTATKEEVQHLYKQGFTDEEVSIRLGVFIGSVRRMRKVYSIPYVRHPGKTLKEEIQPVYIALEDLDFDWYEADVKQVEKYWNRGLHIADISDMAGRDVDEVAMLVMDRIRKNKIKERPGGVFGSVEKQNTKETIR